MGRSDFCSGKVGTSFRASHWLSLDGCGLVCVSLSFSIHIFSFLVLGIFFAPLHSPPSLILFSCVYLPCFIMALWSLLSAWTSDPGAVPMGARPNYCGPALNAEEKTLNRCADTETVVCSGMSEENNEAVNLEELHQPRGVKQEIDAAGFPTLGEEMSNGKASKVVFPQSGISEPAAAPFKSRGIRRCRKCNDNYKPPRAHHDSVTGRCIVKFDHFCPWIGNAVGALNHKFFCLFLMYTLLAAITSGILILIQYIRCDYFNAKSTTPDDEEEDGRPDDEIYNNHNSVRAEECSNSVSPIFLIQFLVTVLFLIFTSCMLFEQVYAVIHNTSKVARMKLRSGQAEENELGRVAWNFNELFGGNSNRLALHWLVPLPVFYPDGMKDVVLGYTWDLDSGNEAYWLEGCDAETLMLSPLVLNHATQQSANDALSSAKETSVPIRVASPKTSSVINRRLTSPARELPYSKLENQE